MAALLRKTERAKFGKWLVQTLPIFVNRTVRVRAFLDVRVAPVLSGTDRGWYVCILSHLAKQSPGSNATRCRHQFLFGYQHLLEERRHREDDDASQKEANASRTRRAELICVCSACLPVLSVPPSCLSVTGGVHSLSLQLSLSLSPLALFPFSLSLSLSLSSGRL